MMTKQCTHQVNHGKTLNFAKDGTRDFPYWDIGNLLNDVPLSVTTVFLARKLRSHDQYIVGKLEKLGKLQEH